MEAEELLMETDPQRYPRRPTAAIGAAPGPPRTGHRTRARRDTGVFLPIRGREASLAPDRRAGIFFRMPVPWIDGHLDLAYLAVEGRDLTAADPAVCVTLPALRAAGLELAFATIFTEPDGHGADPASYRDPDDVEGAAAAGRRQLDVYEDLVRRGEVRLVRTRGDLERDRSAALGLLLLMEGADPIASPQDVAWWHARGLRMVGLTWARGTRYAGGNATTGGLTAAGIELVSALDRCGIVHDASHLSDAAFDGLCTHASGPLVATHSNCRALNGPDQRHLRDEQIRTIDERDGIVGLNLYTRFLAAEGRATIDDCVRHVEHVAGVMGHRRGVALGSDMDGGFDAESLPVGLERPESLVHLADALAARGWSAHEIDGFRGGNWRRFLERVLPA
jgi:membrane dipeptidase